MRKRQYNQRVIEIEQVTFTPLVSSVKVVTEASRFRKTLANKIATKTGERYKDVTRLSFLVLRASLLCLRDSRTLTAKTVKISLLH